MADAVKMEIRVDGILRARLKLALDVIDAARNVGIGPCHTLECSDWGAGKKTFRNQTRCDCGAYDADLALGAALDAFDAHTEELERERAAAEK